MWIQFTLTFDYLSTKSYKSNHYNLADLYKNSVDADQLADPDPQHLQGHLNLG